MKMIIISDQMIQIILSLKFHNYRPILQETDIEFNSIICVAHKYDSCTYVPYL